MGQSHFRIPPEVSVQKRCPGLASLCSFPKFKIPTEVLLEEPCIRDHLFQDALTFRPFSYTPVPRIPSSSGSVCLFWIPDVFFFSQLLTASPAQDPSIRGAQLLVLGLFGAESPTVPTETGEASVSVTGRTSVREVCLHECVHMCVWTCPWCMCVHTCVCGASQNSQSLVLRDTEALRVIFKYGKTLDCE